MKKETKNHIRLAGMILFLGYLLLLIYFLFFAEWYGRSGQVSTQYRYNIQLLREIGRFWRHRDILGFRIVFLNLGGNIIGFIPFGFILPIIYRKSRAFWKISILGFLVSATVECTQLLYHVGSFDVDDMLLNTIGAMLGYCLFAICDKVRRGKYGEKI